LFTETILNNAIDIAQIINTGQKSISDFAKLYENASKYKKWLNKLDNDSSLIEEYYKSIYTNSWGNNSSVKIIRFLTFTAMGIAIDALGAGGLGTGVSVAVSAVDSFLLDSIIKGWKPNQFINNELVNFMQND